MAGTDAAGVESATTASALDLETRKAIQGLRKLFPINPGECHLFTREVEEVSHGVDTQERWLSDRYVMLKVEGHTHTDLVTEDVPDGMYKLTAGKGLIPLAADFIAPETAGLLDHIEGNTDDWYQMHRTQWSMADDEARKMLCHASVWHGGLNTPAWERGWWPEPLAIHEGIWTEVEKHFTPPDCKRSLVKFEYAPGRPYRVSYGGTPVAYVASADFPKAMRPQALRLLGDVEDEDEG